MKRTVKQNGQVARNASWLIGGNIVHKLIAFLVSLWTARFLGPGNYGLLNYASAYTTFFFSLATLGINSVIVKQFIDQPEQEGTTLGTALVLQGVASLLSVAVILNVVFVVDFGETTTILVVFLSSLGLCFQVLDTVKYWFQAKLESKYVAISTTVAYVVSSLYKIILLACGKNVVWFAIATSIDYLCVAVILFRLYKVKKGPHLCFSRSSAKKLLKNSYPYILSGLMIAVYGATDRLMLKQMLDEEAVGFYSTAVSLANMWVFILGAIIDSLKPVIIGLRNTDYKAYIRMNTQLYRIIFYVSLIVSCGITIFADYGISLLYGSAYQGAVLPLQIITWYTAFSYLGVARDIWVVCETHQRYLFGVYAVSAFINVVLNWILIPCMGASGAAIASLISQISTVFIAPLCMKEMRPNVKMMIDAIDIRKTG